MFRSIARRFGKIVLKGLWIFLLCWVAYTVLNFASSVIHLVRAGIPFRAALNAMLRIRLGMREYSWPVASVGLGVIFGLLLFFRRRKNAKQETEEEEVPAETAVEKQESEEKQEEEIIETKHYMFH